MRELVIRFRESGEMFHEIDSDRNYYLIEAERIVESIKVRLKNEKRVATPKEFEFLVDGELLVVTSIRFEQSTSLESLLEDTITSNDTWHEDTKNQYLNKINGYIVKEREYFSHEQLKSFLIRIDEVLGGESTKPFPLLIRTELLKELFDAIIYHIDSGYYSKLEDAVRSVHETIQVITDREDINQLNDFTEWLDHEHMGMFKNYVLSHYHSLPIERMESLYPTFPQYQELAEMLFTDFTEEHGFDTVYRLQNEMIKEFYYYYHEVLFSGFKIESDEDIYILVLYPVIQKYRNMFSNKDTWIKAEANDVGGVKDDENQNETIKL